MQRSMVEMPERFVLCALRARFMGFSRGWRYWLPPGPEITNQDAEGHLDLFPAIFESFDAVSCLRP